MSLRSMLLSLLLLAIVSQHVAKEISKPEHRECTSIDIRNECSKMRLLDNCTVITGYVMITLMPSPAQQQCNYSDYSFPKLREITDFLIFTEVRGLINISNVFPNLTVIRGRRLFLNYAMGITSMPDLERLEFPSLVAIQRGHIYIGGCPKLCQLERINWDRLTLSTGENHIVVGAANCSRRSICQGCDSTYCWSNFKCQRFENDSVLRNSLVCHAQCLGGCFDTTAAGCVVCRGLSDAGVCVAACPEDKYVLERYQRCYTRAQCVEHHGHFTFGFECVAFCPSGYKANDELNCVPCDKDEPCISICSPEHYNEAMTIYNLADAEDLRGCQIVNSSLVITIRNKVNEDQLAHSLASIREIRGHLKIYRSSQLTSLEFLRNLQRIHGDPLENRHYALILYDNKQLRNLWLPDAKLEFVNGGMFMHRNNKLCNRIMREFQASVIHDKTLDSLQTSDQEVMCGPAKLQLNVEVLSHRVVELSWLRSQTSEQLEFIYRPLPAGALYAEDQSELEAPICTRINWQRRLIFADELPHNETHFSYQLEQLHPNTRYACLVRTFGDGTLDYQRDARSDLTYVQTKADKPLPPRLTLDKKTDNSLVVRLAGDGSQDFYQLTVYELPDDSAYLDERDYCKQPAWQDMNSNGMWHSEWSLLQEDYDDCCAQQAELADDRRFVEQMREEYRCRLDAPKDCELAKEPSRLPLLEQRLPGNATDYTLRDLQRYRLYALQLQSCSNSLDCSSASILNERTNYTMGGDLLPELSACHVPGSNEYLVRFAEPVLPNGMVVSYVIHYRDKVSETLTVGSHVSCVTRRQHAALDFVHLSKFNVTYNECAVRVHSLAGDVMTAYVPISWCTEEQRTTHKPTTPSTATEQGQAAAEQGPAVEDSPTGHGTNIFLLCFLSGCLVAAIWVLYKRRCWRQLPALRRYVPVRQQWLLERQQTEDREILVDGFETVRFQNNNNAE